ncbi:MAG: LysM peptidoglycan-binding domain-containing protein [Deltaproteobacteria bacterium]|nr:LysM peptidoglycan-binding domain-containing protein [Deltaproteobacteria bacterium]
MTGARYTIIYFMILLFVLIFPLVDGSHLYGGDTKDSNPSQEGVVKPMQKDEKKSVNSSPGWNIGGSEEKGSAEAGQSESKSKGGEVQQEQDMMDAAMRLLSESHDYWIKGDSESALEMLDQAYALILETDGDPEIARQKDDLRLLISKRILSIYSGMQTTAKGKRGEIPIIMNADVEKEIRSFQTGERNFFVTSYQRSGLYRPDIVKELKRLGLPEELSWLPLVESGFKISALSSARALGLWQFIPSTGYKYGLERDQWIDERMDPEKSTRAAIAYLKDLHGMFGDWLTVLAGYNCGENRVLRVISKQHINYLDRFWDLYHQLPYETARYVPRFLATIHIVRDPKKYGMDLGTPMSKQGPGPGYEVVKTNKSMRLQDIAQHLNIPEETLGQLNPELRFKITPENEYALKVPTDMAGKYASVAETIPRWEKPLPTPKSSPVAIAHRVKRGESIGSIAKKYRTSPQSIRTYNHLSEKSSVKAGQYLSIPIRSAKVAKKGSYGVASEEGKKKAGSGEFISYKVKKGDTLASIAKMSNTTVTAIKKTNRMKKNIVKAGEVIKIARTGDGNANPETPASNVKSSKKKVKGTKSTKTVSEGKKNDKTYVVKKGDSLTRIAKSHEMELSRLRELNDMKGKNPALKEGQLIVLE